VLGTSEEANESVLCGNLRVVSINFHFTVRLLNLRECRV
jgi:hypothetical protein